MKQYTITCDRKTGKVISTTSKDVKTVVNHRPLVELIYRLITEEDK